MKILPSFNAATLVVCCALLAAAPARALDIGFELSARGAISDNLFQDNTGEEEGGAATLTEMQVFGNHESQRFVAGFQGELGLRRRLSDDDRSDSTTLTRFFGSAEFALTRSTSWFFGDVLGGSRDNDTLITDDETEEFDNRRNVLITGPQIKLQLDSVSELEGHLYLIDNSDDAGSEFARLYEFELDYTKQFQGGWQWGLLLENFTVRAAEESTEPDFNRSTIGVTSVRSRNTNKWTGFLGATRFQTGGANSFDTNGASASLRFERTSTDQSTFYAEVSRSIVDQTLNETETLLGTGTADIADVPGIFSDNIIRIGYGFESSVFSLNSEIGAGLSDFEAVFEGGQIIDLEGDAEDQQRVFGSLSAFRAFTPKIGVVANLGFTKEEFLEGNDFTESSFATVSLQYQFSTSFTLRATYLHEILDGLASNEVLQDITDSTENRVFLSVTYSPPTRANKGQVENLKSLLF